jgi:hypothetical protein
MTFVTRKANASLQFLSSYASWAHQMPCHQRLPPQQQARFHVQEVVPIPHPKSPRGDHFMSWTTAALAASVYAPLAPMLRFASFATYDFPQIDVVPALLLPRLKQLKLFDIGITKTAMHRLYCSRGTIALGDQWIQHSEHRLAESLYDWCVLLVV